MKKQKKNMGSLIKKAGVKGMAAGAVSLVLVAGGFHVLWEDYQRGNLFKPELFVKNRELQGNQIMFPEKENIQQNGNDPGENDNKKLEHDPLCQHTYLFRFLTSQRRQFRLLILSPHQCFSNKNCICPNLPKLSHIILIPYATF